MRDLMDALNGRYAEDIGQINTYAITVRELTRTLLARVRGDLAEAQVTDNGEVEVLMELARQLETSLGDPGVAFDEMAERERALEARVAALEAWAWPTFEELLERDS